MITSSSSLPVFVVVDITQYMYFDVSVPYVEIWGTVLHPCDPPEKQVWDISLIILKKEFLGRLATQVTGD